MSGSKYDQRWLVTILLLIFSGVAFYLRIVPAYDGVFTGDLVKFNANDSYFFLRQIDSFAHNFPHLFSVDPYLNYPHGFVLGTMNLFVYLLGSITWVLGLGSSSEHTLDTICAFYPAVAGMLIVIPVYFIGKTMFDRRVGIIAAALIAILPGEFMAKTTLGYADRDALEILLTTSTILFLCLALKNARQKQLTFQHINTRNLSVITIPIIYSLLAGIFLGLSLFIWRGSFLFVLIILTYIIFQAIINHYRHNSFDYICFVGIITFLMALLICWVVFPSQLYLVVLVVSLLVFPILSGLDRVLIRRNMKTFYYPLTVIGIGLFGLGIFFAVSPALFQSILGQLSVFAPTGIERTIAEMKSILFPNDSFTLEIIWLNYTTSFFLSLISMCVLSYTFFKREKIDSPLLLLIVWSLITLIVTLNIRRFAPFLAINIALLTGYLIIILYYIVRFIINAATRRSNEYVSSQLLEFINFKKSTIAKPPESYPNIDYYEVIGVPRNATRKQIKKAHRLLVSKYQTGDTLKDEDRERLRQIERAYAELSDSHKRIAYDRSQYGAATWKTGKIKLGRRRDFQIANRINVLAASLVIFFLVFFPNFKPAGILVNELISRAPNDYWCCSLHWLRENTPEPFDDAAFYYDPYKTSLDYPGTAYTVAAWWDYGYLILRIGHRIPSCDPGGHGDRETVARLFLAQDQDTANEIISDLNSKYVILDDATVTTKFYAVAIHAGTSRERLFDVYYQYLAGKLVPVMYYYPDYYKSLAVRLYYFDGKKFNPSNTMVISYVDKVSREGMSYKEILDTHDFPTSEEAYDYVSRQTSGNYKIASPDPSVSPVPLDSLKEYKLVYPNSQSTPVMPSTTNLTPSVKIFEYIN